MSFWWRAEACRVKRPNRKGNGGGSVDGSPEESYYKDKQRSTRQESPCHSVLLFRQMASLGLSIREEEDIQKEGSGWGGGWVWMMGVSGGGWEAEERGPLTSGERGGMGEVGWGSPLSACVLTSGSFFLFCSVEV